MECLYLGALWSIQWCKVEYLLYRIGALWSIHSGVKWNIYCTVYYGLCIVWYILEYWYIEILVYCEIQWCKVEYLLYRTIVPYIMECV